jgi:hypothetical protein
MPHTCFPYMHAYYIRYRHWQSPGRYHKKLPNSPAGPGHTHTCTRVAPVRQADGWARWRVHTPSRLRHQWVPPSAVEASDPYP